MFLKQAKKCGEVKRALQGVFCVPSQRPEWCWNVQKRILADLCTSLRVWMKSSAVVISMGKKETNLFLAMHKSYFLKGSKLVKIFIGVSSVFLKKKQVAESKRQALMPIFCLFIHLWNNCQIRKRNTIPYLQGSCWHVFANDAVLSYGVFISPVWLFDFFPFMELKANTFSPRERLHLLTTNILGD